MLRGEQGSPTLTRLAVPDAAALDLFSAREASEEPELTGARHSYRWRGGASGVEAAASAEPESVTSPRHERALAAWEQWWRSNLWPEQRLIALSHGRDVVYAIENNGALFWTHNSSLYWLRRDGTRGEHPLPNMGSC